jgi:CrcB protein
MIGLWVSLAGAVGAVSRVALDGAIRGRTDTEFPWSTMVVNLSGSFVLGLVTGLLLFRHDPTNLKLVIGTGFCGGYTTFSTTSFEAVRLIERGLYRAAIGNAAGTLAACMGAAAIGLAVVRI